MRLDDPQSAAISMKNASKSPKKGKKRASRKRAPKVRAAATSRTATSRKAPSRTTTSRTAAPVDEQTPPIVGIGASAGGLEAFTELLHALPGNTGMAFVLVQHLEPKHESVLTTLLSRATKMPVREVRERMRVQPNHVYVIPANADLSLQDGMLHIVDRKAPAGRHLPIDSFLLSLAAAQGPRAIGVVLSGTASDGTAGLKAIKAAGGVTFAEEPESARFDGMPRSAIAAGCVDFVLTPARIARRLGRIARHPSLLPSPAEEKPDLPLPETEWARLFHILRTGSGVDFSLYKQSTIKRRVARRMDANKVEDLRAYLAILERSRQEVDALFEELLILVTSFFRDPAVFLALQRDVFPSLLSAKPAGEPIRVWVAGCSTGEEAYSIAIVLAEYLKNRVPVTPIQIFATDISEVAVEAARAGIYTEHQMKGVSGQRRKDFFTRVNGHYRVNENIREMCVFARHDLTRDPPFSKLDLLSCRNVLIYFGPDLQKRALAAFHYALKSHGGLLLGRTESLSAHLDLFSVVDRKNKFFTKNTTARASFHVAQPAQEHAAPDKLLEGGARRADLEKEADRIVWERYAHAGLVVNSDLQILHFRGDTSLYLRPAPGRATFQLMRMLREEMALEVRAALQKARRTGKAVRREGIEILQNRRVLEIGVEVRPLPVHEGDQRCFLILFEETGLRSEASVQPATERSKESTVRAKELLRLRAELARTREYVQTIIGEQETTNEELKTANEEALSSMEELQSTNEELETAKEELQSSNEELVTLNEQLQNRNTELAQLTDDLSNVLSGIDIPIVILGADRRIRRFTPPAEKLLGLIPGDVGRLISKLRIGVSLPDLDEVISAVAGNGLDVVREVQSDAGRWFLLRVLPFRTGEKKIEGVLMAFVDIQEIKEHQDALQREQKDRNFIAAILDAAKDLLVVVAGSDGRIVHFNRVCQQHTGYSLEEVRGRFGWDFLLLPQDVEPVKALFREIAGGKPIQREITWIAKDGQQRLISWSNSVVMNDGKVEAVIGTGIDVTEHQVARQRALESEATVRALLETAAQAILASGKDGRIVLANATAEKMYGYGRGEMLGQPLESLVPRRLRKQHEAHRAAWFADPRNRTMGARLDLRSLRKDGTEFPVEISLSYIDTHEGTLSVAFVSDITDRKKNEATLLQYQEQLRKLTASLLVGQESGNREVARELHDVFSQELAALGMEVSLLLKSADRGTPLAENLAEVGRKLGQLADDIHRTSRQLHPAILDELGLEAALREECERVAKQNGIPVAFDTAGLASPIPGPASLCLYRVAQEALRNINKHAGAVRVRVRLEGVLGGVHLRIEDFGDGFDLEEARRKGGLGLISMEERVRLVNGKLSIRSAPGNGTTVEVFVPVE